MEIKKIKTIYFSPTGTSKKIVKAIEEGARTASEVDDFDLTYPSYDQHIDVAGDELAIIGVPVYGGRIAPLAAERLKGVSGNNSPAIVVVLYGNRDFEDALIELRNIMLAQSFAIVAASVFIGEHSFSSTAMPIGHGRPDEEDLAVAKEFGKKVMKQILTSPVPDNGNIDVPGNIPYKDGMKSMPFTPSIDIEKCTQCEICISTCPGGAISLDDEIKIDMENCTFCCACIKNCPEDAFSIEASPIQEARKRLHTNCQERKEPKFFL